MKQWLYFILILSSFTGCIGKGKIDITLNGPNKKSLLNLNVAQVQVLNNQLVINGSNLSGVTQVRLVSNGVTQNLSVESASSSQLVANGISALTIGVGKVFDMILSNANAAATVPVTFTLDDNSITGIKLNDMGANNNDVLTFNGSEWIASAPFSYGLYQGNWDPNSGAFPLIGTSTDGDFYIVSVSGLFSSVNYVAGDWIILDGGSWLRIQSGANSVSSYNGRNGLVVTVPADYVLLKNGSGKLPGSSLNDLANVDLTTTPPVNGNVLKYNGVAWVPGVAGGAAGAVGSTEITDLSITGADVAENTINLSKLYSPSSNAALYLRGDKTWANFVTDVLNAPLSTYSLSATAKPSILVTDTLGPALGKIQKFLNDLDADYMSKSATSQTVTGTFSFTSPTSFLYTQLPTGASPNEAANVQYVQNYVGTAVSGLSGTAPGTLTTANGAATSSDTTLNVVSTSGYPSTGTLLVGSEAITYTGTTGTSFTGLTRGAYGTTAAGISNGATINNYLFLSRSTTTSTPKMVVTGSGNVGIGTNNPYVPLHVIGATTLQRDGTSYLPSGSQDSPSQMLALYNTNSGANMSAIELFIANNDFHRQKAYMGMVAVNGVNNYSPAIVFGSQDSATSYSERMRINENGFLGIGTISPAVKLDVAGATRLSGFPLTATTLTSSISAGDTIIPVASTAGYPSSGFLQHDAEIVYYTGITGTSFTGVTRGYNGTTASGMNNGDGIMLHALNISNNSTSLPLMTLQASGGFTVGKGNKTPSGTTIVMGVNNTGVNGGNAVIGTNNTNGSQAAYSTVIGNFSNVSGDSGMALGNGVSVDSYGATAIGQNTRSMGGGESVLSWVDTDAQLLVGVGSGPGARANGLVMFKNGKSIFNSGALTNTSSPTISSVMNNAALTTMGSTNNNTAAAFNATNLAGTSLMYVRNDGKVGIGTTNPTNILTLTRDQDAETNLEITNSSAGGSAGAAFVAKNNSGGFAQFGAASSNMNYGGGILANSASVYSNLTNGIILFNDTGTAPIVFATNATERMRINNIGNVGIGTTAPSEMLEVSGNVKATSFITTSDARLKENVMPAEGLEKVVKLKGVQYDWIKDGSHDYGFIAQAVELIFPSAVVTDQITGFKAIKYQNLISPIIESIKDLFAMITGEKLKNQIQDQENEKLKIEVARLEAENLKIKKQFILLDERLKKLEMKK